MVHVVLYTARLAPYAFCELQSACRQSLPSSNRLSAGHAIPLAKRGGYLVAVCTDSLDVDALKGLRLGLAASEAVAVPLTRPRRHMPCQPCHGWANLNA